MQITVNVNLGQSIFIVNEDAYKKLKRYLDDIAMRLRLLPEAKSIMDDVELRIAEIFRQRGVDGVKVASIADVDSAIASIGPAESFGTAYSAAGDSSSAAPERKLMRDTGKDSMAFGVCSGFAAYISVDPVIVRLLFVIAAFFGGTGLVVYIVLIFIMPPARSPQDVALMEEMKQRRRVF